MDDVNAGAFYGGVEEHSNGSKKKAV